MNNAKIEFISRERQHYYNAVRITIIKRTEGVIDNCVLGFENVWGLKEINGNKVSPYIWSYSADDISWYKWWPSVDDKQKLYAAIKSYLELWK